MASESTEQRGYDNDVIYAKRNVLMRLQMNRGGLMDNEGSLAEIKLSINRDIVSLLLYSIKRNHQTAFIVPISDTYISLRKMTTCIKLKLNENVGKNPRLC